MWITAFWLLCGFFSVPVAAVDKRLVLHSDADIASELNLMKLEMASLSTTVQQLQSDNSKLSSTVQELQSRNLQDGGSVYVRWGRSYCPANGTDLVYSGYVGGNHYDHTGGGVNYLCLPEHPTWANYIDGVSQQRGSVYGTEFETPPQDSNALFGYLTDDQDVPCAVCKTDRKIHMMIPARTNCYPGWTMEYIGYLMSTHNNYKSNSDYACVDTKPEFVLHGADDHNDHLMYFVEARCGALSCPPYVEGRELACVVCSM